MRKAVRAIIIRDNQLLVMHRNKFGQEYYTLLGGGIDLGETPDQALVREVKEESGQDVSAKRLVFIEEAGDPFGTQYIYLCETTGGQPALSEASDEAQINTLGKNLYTPVWVPIEQLPTLEFRSSALQRAILHGVQHGFPAQPVTLDQAYVATLQTQAKEE